MTTQEQYSKAVESLKQKAVPPVMVDGELMYLWAEHARRPESAPHRYAPVHILPADKPE